MRSAERPVTAEKLPRGNGKYLLSYIGFAPLDNPEVAIYVVIDEPNADDQSNSGLVLELSRMIMSEAFPISGSPRSRRAARIP